MWPPAGLGEVDDVDRFGTFTPEEAEKMGVRYNDNLVLDEERNSGDVEAVSMSSGGIKGVDKD